DMVQQMLELEGYEVVCAGNGAEALVRARSEMPDVVLMDIGMEVMDGYEATRRLKADPATRAIPVIALTAHASREGRQRARQAGPSDFEPKPINFEQLLPKIQALLGGRNA